MSVDYHKRGEKRGKSYYKQSAGKRRKVYGSGTLGVGMKGFLLTCNRDEKACIRDGYRLLTDYADKFYGPEGDDTRDSSDNESESDEDIEVLLLKESKKLMEQAEKNSYRFQAMQSGANNVVFIRTQSIEDPSDLIYRLLTDVAERAEKVTRHIQRLIPVTATCRANMEDMEKLGARLVHPHFHAEGVPPRAFNVQFKARYNGKAKRVEIIKMLAGLVLKEDSPHKVDLNTPEVTIIVEIIKNICCMSVVKDFHGLKKYNIHSVVEAQLYGEESGHRSNDDVMKVERSNDDGVKVERSNDDGIKDDIPDKSDQIVSKDESTERADENKTTVESKTEASDKDISVEIETEDKKSAKVDKVSPDKDESDETPSDLILKQKANDSAAETGVNKPQDGAAIKLPEASQQDTVTEKSETADDKQDMKN